MSHVCSNTQTEDTFEHLLDDSNNVYTKGFFSISGIFVVKQRSRLSDQLMFCVFLNFHVIFNENILMVNISIIFQLLVIFIFH